MRLFARLANLVRGTLGRWLKAREHANPGAVYEAAIQERVGQYAKLRAAAAGVLYMRGKLEREFQQKSAELGRLKKQLDLAVERDEDAVALALIARRDALGAEVERVRTELTELTAEAEGAKKNLVAFQDEIARLKDERVRMLARLANARARLRLHETLSGLSPEADIQALDAVREHVNRLVSEVSLVREGGDPELERRLGLIRDAEAQAAARAQLDELKRARRASLVPMVIEPVPAAPKVRAAAAPTAR
jgi:phage shock protein A